MVWFVDAWVPPGRDLNVICVLFAVNFLKADIVSYVSGLGLFSDVIADLFWKREAIDHAGKLTFVAWLPKVGFAG